MPPSATAASKLPPLKPGEFRFVTKALSVTSEEGGPRRFRTIASSTLKDLGNDEMKLTALQDMAESFRRGLTIFMNHRYSVPEDVFGRSDTAEIRDSGIRDRKTGSPIWDLHIGGVVNVPNPRAVQLADSIEGGYVTFGTSVGAIVKAHQRNKDGGMDIEHVDCKEGSIVGIPMNQRSWTQKAATAALALDDADGDAEDEDEAEDAAEAVTGAQEPVEKAAEVAPVEVVLGEDGPETVVKAGCPECGGDGPDAREGCKNNYHSSDWDEKTADPTTIETPAEPDADLTTKEATEGDQEADPAATPETSPADAVEADPAIEQKAAEYGSDDVASLVGHVRSLVDTIGQRDEKIAALTDELTAMRTERDQLASENEEAKQVIEKVMTQPLRRKAATQITGLTTRYPDFLAPEVVSYLTKTAGDTE